MNIAIIDGEPQQTQLLSDTLTTYHSDKGFKCSVTIFEDGESFLRTFFKKKYAIIFIDICTESKNKLDTAFQIRKTDCSVILIFLASDSKYMPEAFQCHAFDYIVKPANQNRLIHLMNDCRRVLTILDTSEEHFIEFQRKRNTLRLLIKDLVSVSVSGHTLYITDKKRTIYTTTQTFGSIEKQLKNEPNILRLNRGVLVNMDFIQEFRDGFCYLTDGYRFSVKVRERTQIEQYWRDYIFQKQRNNPH